MKKWLIIVAIVIGIIIIWYFAYGKKWIEKNKRAKEIQKIAADKGQNLDIKDAAALADVESQMSTSSFRSFATKYIQAKASGACTSCVDVCAQVFPGTVKIGCENNKDGECCAKCQDKETGAIYLAKAAQATISNQLFSV